MSGFNYEKDSSGIVTVTMDMDGPVNAMNDDYRVLMGDTVARLETEEGLKGVVFASAKDTFFAGGDLKDLGSAKEGDEEAIYQSLVATKDHLRRIEKLPVPVVAAINGAALGGGLEICLACNYRILLNSPKAPVGLPEVGLGLLPGGGGVVRLVHMIGAEKALPVLLEGKQFRQEQALKTGLVDLLVDHANDLVAEAKKWILNNPESWQQPWDKKGHKIPGGGLTNPKIAQTMLAAAAMTRKKTRGLLPAPERILDVVAQALTIDFDAALRVESRNLVYLIMSPQAKNIINTMFFQLNKVNSGNSRPRGIEKSKVKKLGILGAGMMGQGIAYSSAMAGIDVVLRDISIAAAEKGKAYSEKLLAKAVEKGRMDQSRMDAVLNRIQPTADVSDLRGCDLIIEAVFENLTLKNKVIAEVAPMLPDSAIIGSNTSTLPITRMAETCERPENFIGIHFFSPVDKMPLVEIISGKKTSDETLARVFDYVRQIGKTPILVNDSLGFFTSCTFSTYGDEGSRLLKEGVDPVLIDRMGELVGMPVGPLNVQDETSLELTKKVGETHKELGVFGSKGDFSVAFEVAEEMIANGRGGRYYGGGFYEYPAEGSKHIWPELYKLYVKPEVSLPEQDIKDRLLFRQVIESLKCLEEGVLRTVADGNVGSIMGIGAPMWTGGFIQFVNTYGLQKFVDRSRELAEKYGKRFSPPQIVIDKANAGELFV